MPISKFISFDMIERKPLCGSVKKLPGYLIILRTSVQSFSFCSLPASTFVPDINPPECNKFITVKLENTKAKTGELPLNYWGNMKANYEAHNKNCTGVYKGALKTASIGLIVPFKLRPRWIDSRQEAVSACDFADCPYRLPPPPREPAPREAAPEKLRPPTLPRKPDPLKLRLPLPKAFRLLPL
jgi:hypothetical protein